MLRYIASTKLKSLNKHGLIAAVNDYHALIKESIKSLHEKNFANHHAHAIDLTGGLYSTDFKQGNILFRYASIPIIHSLLCDLIY